MHEENKNIFNDHIQLLLLFNETKVMPSKENEKVKLVIFLKPLSLSKSLVYSSTDALIKPRIMFLIK